jgi:hypothetical protein
MRRTVALKRLSVAVIAALLAALAATVVLSGEAKRATAAVPGVNVSAGYGSEVFYSGAPLSGPAALLFDHSGTCSFPTTVRSMIAQQTTVRSFRSVPRGLLTS